MRFAWLAVPALLFVPVSAGADCATNVTSPAAIEAANEGDRVKAMNLDGAIEKYRHAHELAPQSHRILWKLALAYQKKESWGDMESTLAKAIALAPKHALYAMMRGAALARLSRWEEGRTVLEQAIALDPNLAEGHYALAEIALRLGDEKAALLEYTKAIQLSPADALYYGALADLYFRLGFVDHAERVLVAGEANAKDDAEKFHLYSLHGDIKDRNRDFAAAVTMYEAAKKVCSPCTERGQQIAFFNLGAAYASLTPPRKSEAMMNLQSFQKMVCKGAAAHRYADQCMQAQQLATRLGGTLQ